MSFPQLTGTNLGIIAAMMVVMWIVSLFRRDASIVDPFWGTGFVVIGWVTVFLRNSTSQDNSIGIAGWILLAMVTIWGLRLSGFLYWRNHGKGEDRRYQAMRDKHGNRFWIVSLFTVFLLQGAVMWVVSLPIQAGIHYSSGGSNLLLLIAGIVVWKIGLLFETIGDFQLAQFKSREENHGQVMDRGLWRYTRHPNYFGDFCVWWGHFLIAASVGCWWTVFSPILMAVLLMRVSGVTLLEKDIAERREGYAEYVRKTNAFFPAAPKT